MYRSLICLAVSAMLYTSSSYAADTFRFDPSHTNIHFAVDHAGFSQFMAEFQQYDGDIVLDFDNPAKSHATIRVMPESVDTDLPDFDKKLQSSAFFDTATYPQATFNTTNVNITGENTADITGDFTLKGQTHPLTLHAVMNKHGYDKWRKTYKAGLSLTGVFKRSEWGFDTYVPVVGDEVTLTIETEIERPLKESETLPSADVSQ